MAHAETAVVVLPRGKSGRTARVCLESPRKTPVEHDRPDRPTGAGVGGTRAPPGVIGGGIRRSSYAGCEAQRNRIRPASHSYPPEDGTEGCRKSCCRDRRSGNPIHDVSDDLRAHMGSETVCLLPGGAIANHGRGTHIRPWSGAACPGTVSHIALADGKETHIEKGEDSRTRLLRAMKGAKLRRNRSERQRMPCT